MLRIMHSYLCVHICMEITCLDIHLVIYVFECQKVFRCKVNALINYRFQGISIIK